MFRSSGGEELESVYKLIRGEGIVTHSDLVRRLGYKMDAARIKSIVDHLKQSKQIEETNDPLFGHAYRLREAR
jgi:hypothetical protein